MGLPVQRLLDAALAELEDNEPGYEYSRWTKPEMLGYVASAVAALHFYKPDLFQARALVRLRPGDVQQVDGSHSRILSLEDNADANGAVGAPIYASNHDTTKALRRPNQFSPMEPYRVRSCAVDKDNPRVYYVNPPAPEYPRAHAWGFFQFSPPEIVDAGQDIELPATDAAGWFNALLDFVLFRAFAKDTESNTSRTKSRDHEIAFMNAVGAKNRLDRLQEGVDE
jgi:hypothetical protein